MKKANGNAAKRARVYRYDRKPRAGACAESGALLLMLLLNGEEVGFERAEGAVQGPYT